MLAPLEDTDMLTIPPLPSNGFNGDRLPGDISNVLKDSVGDDQEKLEKYLKSDKA